MNGKIKTKVVAQYEFDEDGNPIGSDLGFGFEIPCKYVSASRNDTFESGDGIFSQASFVVTVSDMSFDAKHVMLINSRNEIVCEKNVKSLEVLEAVQRVKIIL